MSPGRSVMPSLPSLPSMPQLLSSCPPELLLLRLIASRQALPQGASVTVPTPQQLFSTMQQQQQNARTPVHSQPATGLYRPEARIQPPPPPPPAAERQLPSVLHQWTGIPALTGEQPVAQDLSTQNRQNRGVSGSPGQEVTPPPVTTTSQSSPSTNSSPSDPNLSLPSDHNLSLPSDPAGESGQAAHLLDFAGPLNRFCQQANGKVESSLHDCPVVEPISSSAGQYLASALHEIQRANYIRFYEQLFTHILSNIHVRNSLTAGSSLSPKTENPQPPPPSSQPCSSSQNAVPTNSPMSMPMQTSFTADHSFGSLSLGPVVGPQKLEPQLHDMPSSRNPSPGSVNGVFTCHLCPKSYSQSSALKMHVRTHTLPCRCSHCGKSFSRKWLLKGHERTHTGERPYACTVCSRSFADRSNLRAHLQTHQREKRYACSTCPRSFSRMGLLNKHIAQCPGKAGANGHPTGEVKIKPVVKGGAPAGILPSDHSHAAFLTKRM